MASDDIEHTQQPAPEAEDLDELPGLDDEADGGAAEPAPIDLLAKVQQERDELEQRLLRTTADYQNFIKRSQQNVVAAEEQTLLGVARSLVTVMDHFDRALDVEADKAQVKDVLAGLQIVHDELLAALGRFGIERVDAEAGTPFDPNYHEALMRQPADDIETDHVVQQFQPGYKLKDKPVRPAQVSVAQ